MFEYLGERFSLSDQEYKAVVDWVSQSFYPTKYINDKYHEGMVKHWFELDPNGFYIHNEVLIQAMQDCGYLCHKTRSWHYVFNISSHSPLFESWGCSPELYG